ncbi:hypothetical protein [Curvibacter gracilis]|uniref:hypothetical protein n=1 Tax=Curvibacter gracilis TaxID=230310 RepID=UPI0012FB547C|nr:hypothetical protein [Curvibacter gracilis]
MAQTQKLALTDLALDSTACILMREFGCAELALEFAKRKAAGQGPVAQLYQEAVLQLRSEVARSRELPVGPVQSKT